MVSENLLSVLKWKRERWLNHLRLSSLLRLTEFWRLRVGNRRGSVFWAAL